MLIWLHSSLWIMKYFTLKHIEEKSIELKICLNYLPLYTAHVACIQPWNLADASGIFLEIPEYIKDACAFYYSNKALNLFS